MSDNRRIAKNALMLYIRMFLTMIVGLYTSRVVLATLGVEDYGIYGVVGGVVAMMGFLNASMSGATSRFLTFELGRGDKKRLADTFSSALIVHIGIALIVFILAETVGLWFLCNKLVIPAGRMTAAHWVYQCSIISAMLGITQAPYNASIIAHEKMDVYAYVEILNVTLKLLIVYLLVIGNFDKLILYALLTLAVSIIIRMIYRIYCIRRFPETHFHWLWNKEILKPLLSFSGWDLYGNMSVTAKQQGINFLINIFFGVVYNAASGIATTVQGILLNFSHNILTAFRPQAIKLYAQGKVSQSMEMIYQATKLSTLLIVIISVPLFVDMDFILGLWLVKVPPMTTVFCRLLLIGACLNIIKSSLNIGIHATGNIRKMSILTGTLYLLCVVVVWIGYALSLNVEFAYYVTVGLNALLVIINTVILKELVNQFSFSSFFVKSIQPIAIVSLLAFGSIYFIMLLIKDSSTALHLIMFGVNIIIGCLITLAIGLNRGERQTVLKFVKNRFSHE